MTCAQIRLDTGGHSTTETLIESNVSAESAQVAEGFRGSKGGVTILSRQAGRKPSNCSRTDHDLRLHLCHVMLEGLTGTNIAKCLKQLCARTDGTK